MIELAEKRSNNAAIDRIAALTGAARATWLSFLGVLIFVGVTLLGISDADFFIAEHSVELPLIGVSVPVILFFVFAAGFVTVIHIYLHVFLEELWSTLAAAPSEVDGQRLATAISPWLVNAFALRFRSWVRRDEPPAITATVLGMIGSLASFVLLYAAAPMLLAGLWLRSQIAHDAWLTVVIGLMIVLSAAISFLSLAALRRAFLPTGAQLAAKKACVTALLIAALAAVPLSLTRTVWDPFGVGVTRYPRDGGPALDVANWFRPAIADLSGLHLTRMSTDWLPHEESLAAFTRTWCAERLEPDCQQISLADPEFKDAYRSRRDRWLAVQEKPDLSDRNMDHADLVHTFLPGVALNGTTLRRADMQSAQMEGVTAHSADMTAAVLLDAHLDFARARHARFAFANMIEISAVGADLVDSDLSEASLSGADLRYGILNAANFQGASLIRARLDHTWLHRANFGGATLHDADFTGASLVQSDFSQANLEGARLHGATVSGVDFAGALLAWSLIADQGKFSFGRTDFSGARLFGVGLRGVDASHAIFDGPEQLNWVFGDASVTLPKGTTPPCHWSDRVLDEQNFHAHWRGVVEAMSVTRRWAGLVPGAFADVAAVPPPEGCNLVEFTFDAMMFPPRTAEAE